MRIAWLAAGSRGDVQPAAVAAAALQQRGHEVVLAVPADLAHLGTALGVRSTSLGFAVRDLLRSPEGAAMLTDGDVRGFAEGVIAVKRHHLTALTAGLLAASEGADVVVGAGLLREEAAAIAAVQGAALVLTGYAPRFPNGAHPPIGLPPRRRPAAVNLAAHRLVATRTARVGRAWSDRFRSAVGAGPTGRSRTPALEPQLYSRHLVPRLPDRARRPLLGFVRPTAAQHAAWGEPATDPALEAWLADGPPPVWFGFGSMPVLQVDHALDVVRRVADRLGVRALVGTGWSSADDPAAAHSTDRVRVVGEIDHATVLPACSAAVHHGGAGTTAASVGAGLPTLVCAVAFDQPFWGERVAELGIGAWMPFAAFAEDALVAALGPLLRPEVAQRAQAVADRLRHDRPLDRLGDLLEAIPDRPQRRPARR